MPQSANAFVTLGVQYFVDPLDSGSLLPTIIFLQSHIILYVYGTPMPLSPTTSKHQSMVLSFRLSSVLLPSLNILSPQLSSHTILPPSLHRIIRFHFPLCLSQLTHTSQHSRIWSTHFRHGNTNLFHSSSRIFSNIGSPSSIPILAACDGGANTTTTFGWTIRRGTTNLATCYGPVSGYRTNLYHAKATGLLSLLMLLDLLWLSHLSSPSSALPIYIDNQALCKRIHTHQQRLYYSLTEALAPERDIILQIEHILDHSPIRITIHHEHGHQDCHTPLHLLSLSAQANCCADNLATYAQAVTISNPVTSLLPTAGCLILVNNATVTRAIPQLLRHHAHELHLRTWILRSREWTSTEYIDWTEFTTYCLRNTSRMRFYIRWTHRVLPTGHVLHRRNPQESLFCPACGQYKSLCYLLPSIAPSSKNQAHLVSSSTHPDFYI